MEKGWGSHSWGNRAASCPGGCHSLPARLPGLLPCVTPGDCPALSCHRQCHGWSHVPGHRARSKTPSLLMLPGPALLRHFPKTKELRSVWTRLSGTGGTPVTVLCRVRSWASMNIPSSSGYSAVLQFCEMLVGAVCTPSLPALRGGLGVSGWPSRMRDELLGTAMTSQGRAPQHPGAARGSEMSGLYMTEPSCTGLKTFILEGSGCSWLKAINTDLIS